MNVYRNGCKPNPSPVNKMANVIAWKSNVGQDVAKFGDFEISLRFIGTGWHFHAILPGTNFVIDFSVNDGKAEQVKTWAESKFFDRLRAATNDLAYKLQMVSNTLDIHGQLVQS